MLSMTSICTHSDLCLAPYQVQRLRVAATAAKPALCIRSGAPPARCPQKLPLPHAGHIPSSLLLHRPRHVSPTLSQVSKPPATLTQVLPHSLLKHCMHCTRAYSYRDLVSCSCRGAVMLMQGYRSPVDVPLSAPHPVFIEYRRAALEKFMRRTSRHAILQHSAALQATA